MSRVKGSGIEVVQVEGGSYQLDIDALQSILLRPEVKDLPVVVVSVAGAYRRGKSFLLNFFLRYINSPRSSQLDGSWLGEPEAPLEGFSWRGGSTRNTTGIVMWSEPVVTTLHTGEKVAVILMDTQGTFDSHSTVKDCSTIFALSTLLSSVQIYNLSQIIREDDLQHLQLFTAYGNLLKDTDSKAYQVLEFLVRDWPNADADHPYGSVGGNEYLEEIFQIREDMKTELQDLREHIRSSFQLLSCFLLPHPGLVVSKSNYKGETIGLEPEFKIHIQELTSHIFGPTRMNPKEIGGQILTASSLYTYFDTYMKVFSSDKLPSPKTIMEATAEASLLSIFEEARRLYENSMEADCGPSQPSLPTHDLKYLHENHSARAISLFTTKKKMGSKSDADKYQEKLKEEMEKRLSQHVDLNIGKMQKTLNEAREMYETRIGQIKKEEMLCVHPLDLKDVHLGALQAVVDLFDRNRRKISKEIEDKDRANFIMTFEEQYRLEKQLNDLNNKMIVTDMRLQYWQTMENKCSGEILSEREFQEAHRKALAKAVEGFGSRRNFPNFHNTDEFKTNLIELIDKCREQLSEINDDKIEAAIDSGIKAYDKHMADVWDPKQVCLHPGDIEKEKEKAERKAMAAFRPSRFGSGEVDYDTIDDHEKTLVKKLEKRYVNIEKENDAANETAVTAAVQVYINEMDNIYASSNRTSVALFFINVIFNNALKYEVHAQSTQKAYDLFFTKRRPSGSNFPDKFMSDLKKRIAAKRRDY